MIRHKQRQELSDLFSESTMRTSLTSRRSAIAQRSLAGLVSRRKGLHRNYKGNKYSATLFPNGTIIMAKNNYFSPTAEAKAVVDTSQVNGWNFRYIEDVNGDKIKLSKYAEQVSRR
jgi:hypothetical protein